MNDENIGPFVRLLMPRMGEMPSDTQTRARNHLPNVLSTSRLHLWKPGDPVAASDRRLLIGVATYSVHDLKILDLIDRLDFAEAKVWVDVFDIAECQSPKDFDRYIAGIGERLQNPFVGLWNRGKLIERAWGYEGRELIARTLGLPNDAVQPPRFVQMA